MANNTTVGYGTLLPSVYISLSICLIILTIVAIFLNTMLWLYLKKAKTPSVIFIRAILLSLSPPILVGVPLQLMVYTKSLSFIECRRSKSISVLCLMSTLLMILWQLAGLTFQRYCFIVGKDHLCILSKTKYWVAMLLLFGIIGSACITYELFWNASSLSFCYITYRVPVKQCSSTNNCTRYITLSAITIAEVVCNMVILFSTLKLKKHIKNHEKKASVLLGSRRLTNFQRLKATNYLWIAYSVIWIPFESSYYRNVK